MHMLVVLGLSLLLIMMQGCAFWGQSLTLTAQENDFPISFSEGIWGYDNKLILRDGYEVIFHFTMEKSTTTWNIWHYLIGNPKRFDLSNEFEELVRSHNGEAIVNLKITEAHHENTKTLVVVSMLTGILTFGLIAPMWTDLNIEGDVIRLKTTTAWHNASVP